MFIKDGRDGPRELQAEMISARGSLGWGLGFAWVGGMKVKGLCWL